MAARKFYPVTVKQTKEQIGGMAKSVFFDIPKKLQDIFIWRAGQHITVKFTLNGDEVRRSYSISSSPVSEDGLRITVKRVKNGLVSNHINDNVEAGDVVNLMPPFGSFCLDTDSIERRTHYFFGAGSGITPLYSMLHSVLIDEPYSVVHIIYGNRNADSIIFKDKIEQLTLRYPERITVSHVFSDSSIWDSYKPWRTGYIDKEAVEAFLTENAPYAQNCQYYICGPGVMNKSVKEALLNLDVPKSRIHMESYGNKVEDHEIVEGVSADAIITLNGKENKVKIASDQTLLEAAKAANLNPPFSCQAGVCGACKASLNEGQVYMSTKAALDEDELKSGVVLTCQAVAKTSSINISYD